MTPKGSGIATAKVVASTNGGSMARRFYPISNDQMFKHVFGSDKELCRRLIELALETHITAVQYVQAQYESKDVGRRGGTYFDVLAITGTGQLIDVEMQSIERPGMVKRARLYSARLTREAWSRLLATEDEPGYDYSKLPNIAVIFVCDFDPLGIGLRRYTRSVQYSGVGEVDDGTAVVFLNAQGSGDDIEPDLAAFLDYVASNRCLPGKSAFVDEVAQKVTIANDDVTFREGFMDLDEKLWWSRQDGKKEGREEGHAEGREEGIQQGIEQGIQQGSREGSEQERSMISQLASRMVAEGRLDELPGILSDGQRLEAELRRYKIKPATRGVSGNA